MGFNYGEHGRCEAQSKTTGERCRQPAVDNRGVCYYHGGATPLKNGIYSDVVREEDRDVLDALEELTTRQKLEETLNLQIMKLRRAVALLDDPDREQSFWDTFATLVENADDLDAGEIQSLAQMLDTPHRAQRDLMDLIRKTAKDLHKITDGETVNMEHGFDSDELAELSEKAESLF